ncbi:hypothetical protein [Vibrio phage JSF9]|uniref:Uncharacterized protein n=1 Tax=Vibrio phage JSF9 TaxID=1983616 RepID=A0A2D0Z4M1_9CAUD|nr:hypothetical protein [Vibrio phage JSF9]
MWDKDTVDFTNHANNNLARKDGVAESGFGSGFSASVDNEMASGLSVSRYIMSAPIRERNAKIRDLMNEDPDIARFRSVSINPNTGYPESSYDYDAAADYLIERGDEGFQSTAELTAQIQESVKQTDEMNRIIGAEANALGVAGSFAGAFASQTMEPLNYVAVIPGLGQAASMSVKAKAAVGAVEGALASALAQPAIKGWKNENDIEYTTKDVVLDVGMSAAFGGALSALSHWVSGAISGIKSKKADAIDADSSEALSAAESRLNEFKSEVEHLDALPDELKPDTAKAALDPLDETAKLVAKGEDQWVEPANPYAKMADEEIEPVLEQSLGIERKKPEGEGVDVDTPEQVVLKDETLFDFEVDGQKAADVVKGYDDDIKKLEDTFACMMGG